MRVSSAVVICSLRVRESGGHVGELATGSRRARRLFGYRSRGNACRWLQVPCGLPRGRDGNDRFEELRTARRRSSRASAVGPVPAAASRWGAAAPRARRTQAHHQPDPHAPPHLSILGEELERLLEPRRRPIEGEGARGLIARRLRVACGAGRNLPPRASAWPASRHRGASRLEGHRQRSWNVWRRAGSSQCGRPHVRGHGTARSRRPTAATRSHEVASAKDGRPSLEIGRFEPRCRRCHLQWQGLARYRDELRDLARGRLDLDDARPDRVVQPDFTGPQSAERDLTSKLLDEERVSVCLDRDYFGIGVGAARPSEEPAASSCASSRPRFERWITFASAWKRRAQAIEPPSPVLGVTRNVPTKRRGGESGERRISASALSPSSSAHWGSSTAITVGRCMATRVKRSAGPRRRIGAFLRLGDGLDLGVLLGHCGTRSITGKSLCKHRSLRRKEGGDLARWHM